MSRLEMLLALWLVLLTAAFYVRTMKIGEAVEFLFEANYNITAVLNQTVNAVMDLYKIAGNNSMSIRDLENRVKIAENKISYLLERYEELRRQKGLINPSYAELVEFVAEDLTDTLVYTDYFTCVDFANTFVKNFRNRGYYSCVAYVEFEKSAHDLVAVNTTDRGILYVEPQNDAIIYSLKVGDNYCSKVGWDCNYVIKKLSSCFQ
jgi:hypothetical protein